MKGVIGRKYDQLIVRQYFPIQKLEDAVLCCFYGGNISGKSAESGANFVACTPKKPPPSLDVGVPVFVPFWLYCLDYVLIDLRIIVLDSPSERQRFQLVNGKFR